MSQIWKDSKVVPVTIVKAEPNEVSLIRTKDKDGYEAVQVKLGRVRREFRTVPNSLKVGDTIQVSVFKEGDLVAASGTSKGRGFQGVVKRHGFSGGPKTRGQKNRWRAPGSIGSTAPQRVFPGRKMAGHMGVERVTVKNLQIAAVDPEKNLILIRGALPGRVGSLVEIKS